LVVVDVTPSTLAKKVLRARVIRTPTRSHGAPSKSGLSDCVGPPTTSGCSIIASPSGTGIVIATVYGPAVPVAVRVMPGSHVPEKVEVQSGADNDDVVSATFARK
jgi:hypothetical protein